METIAIYREAIIKTYGFMERSGLGLVTVDLPSNRMEDWGTGLMDQISRWGVSLVLLMARPSSGGKSHLILLLDKVPPEHLVKDTQQVFFNEYHPLWRVYPAVDLVYFQGPHYGDRYGIAGAALNALSGRGVPVLGVSCTGASVYLITPQGKAGAAREALNLAFTDPIAGNGTLKNEFTPPKRY